LATYQRNDTELFMKKNFDEDDHKFIMKMGRELDESGIEQKRQNKVVMYNKEKVAKRTEKQKQEDKETAENNARLAKVTLIFDKDVIEGLKGAKLQDQLDAFRLFQAPLPALKKDVRLVPEKKKAIQKAIDDHFEPNGWVPRLPKAIENEDPEDFELGEEQEEGEE
jgi:hypothetical protein